MSKLNIPVRYSGENKFRASLFDNLEVSMQQLRHKVSQTMPSTDLPRNKPSKDQRNNNKTKNTSNPKRRKSKSKGLVMEQRIQDKERDNPENIENNQRKKVSSKRVIFSNNDTKAEPSTQQFSSTLLEIKTKLSFIPLPSLSIKSITRYYDQLFEMISQVQNQSVRSLLAAIQMLCISPAEQMFDLMMPYEELLLRKKEVEKGIEEQMKVNERVRTEGGKEEEDKELWELQKMIEYQQREIDELKNGIVKSNLEEVEYRHSNFNNELEMDKQQENESRLERKSKQKEKHRELKSVKINLGLIKPNQVQGYHDQFMSHFNEMSESWRDQAIRQKRF